VLNKQVQVTHAKWWSLTGMIKSDVFDRAVPWTRLILRDSSLPNDLNLTWPQRISAALACSLCALFIVAALQQPILLLIPLLVVVLVIVIDQWSARARIPTAARLAGSVVMVSAVGVTSIRHELAATFFLLAGGIVCLNAGFYGFFARERNVLFAATLFPLHLSYFVYSAGAFSIVAGSQLIRRCCSSLFRVAFPAGETDAAAGHGTLPAYQPEQPLNVRDD
jgi:hypothetical protein